MTTHHCSTCDGYRARAEAADLQVAELNHELAELRAAIAAVTHERDALLEERAMGGMRVFSDSASATEAELVRAANAARDVANRNKDIADANKQLRKKAEAERDALRADVARLTADHQMWRDHFDGKHGLDLSHPLCHHCLSVQALARAERAERERDELWQGIRDALVSRHVDLGPGRWPEQVRRLVERMVAAESAPARAAAGEARLREAVESARRYIAVDCPLHYEDHQNRDGSGQSGCYLFAGTLALLAKCDAALSADPGEWLAARDSRVRADVAKLVRDFFLNSKGATPNLRLNAEILAREIEAQQPTKKPGGGA